MPLDLEQKARTIVMPRRFMPIAPRADVGDRTTRLGGDTLCVDQENVLTNESWPVPATVGSSTN
jgi:hypothetical protein